MLTIEKIKELFLELNDRLREKGEIGEVGLVGGAVMCLVFNARQSTKDIDAIFEPTKIIRGLVAEIATRHHLPPDWLNDAAKGFVQGQFERVAVFNFSNLRIWAPEPKYMLAMKCISARWDTHDQDDIVFLLKHLKLVQPKEVFEIIQRYYPKEIIPPKTQFAIEEILT
jgi:hypothetical protein